MATLADVDLDELFALAQLDISVLSNVAPDDPNEAIRTITARYVVDHTLLPMADLDLDLDEEVTEPLVLATLTALKIPHDSEFDTAEVYDCHSQDLLSLYEALFNGPVNFEAASAPFNFYFERTVVDERFRGKRLGARLFNMVVAELVSRNDLVTTHPKPDRGSVAKYTRYVMSDCDRVAWVRFGKGFIGGFRTPY